jgi:hypothetical protein
MRRFARRVTAKTHPAHAERAGGGAAGYRRQGDFTVKSPWR